MAKYMCGRLLFEVTSNDGRVNIRVRRDIDTNEYIGFYRYDGKLDEGKHNFETDLPSAIGTAKATIEQYNKWRAVQASLHSVENNIVALKSYIESMNHAIHMAESGSTVETGYFIEKLERMANRLGYTVVKQLNNP